MADEINVFIIYAREDREVKQRLLKHLNPLKDAYNLSIWHDDYIEPGQEWKPSIESRLAKTDLFLLLVSADFMNSEFIHQVEFKFAINRHKQNKSVVIPLIIDYCIWDVDIRYKDGTFNMKDLQVLPDEAKPIGEWKTSEQAYNNIASGIRKVLSTIQAKRKQAIVPNTAEDETKKASEKNIQPEKHTIVTEEQRPVQKEKEKPSVTFIETPEKEVDTNGYKKIIYALLIVVAVFIIGYFIVSKPAKKQLATNQATDTTTTVTYEPAKQKDNPDKPVHKSAFFYTFDNALALVYNDASQNFANLKGAYTGTEDGMKKFQAILALRDKTFQPSYLFEDTNEWQFIFVNKNLSNYESIKASIIKLLNTQGIKYDYEPSASMAVDKYSWSNQTFEIDLAVRKYSDNFIEIRFHHQKS